MRNIRFLVKLSLYNLLLMPCLPSSPYGKVSTAEFSKRFFGIFYTRYINMSFLMCVFLEQNTFSSTFKQLTKLFQSLEQVLLWKPTRMTKCNEKIESGKCEEFPLWSFFSSYEK